MKSELHTNLPERCFRSSMLQNSCALQHNELHEMEDEKEIQAGERLSNGRNANLHFIQVCFERECGGGGEEGHPKIIVRTTFAKPVQLITLSHILF